MGAALLLACGGCGDNRPQGSRSQRDEGIPVTVARVAVMPLDRTLSVFGTLLPKTEATVGAQVEGQVEKALVDFGDRVAEGQELALIDTASYEAIAHQLAAAVAKAKASALNAEQNLKRVLALQESKISSASDLDSATAQAAQARAEVKSAEAAEVIAQLNLKRSRVTALFAGTISERIANSGDFVKVGSPLVRVVEDGELKFVVQAPERYAGQVKPGQVVKFEVDARPGETFEGTVYLISPSVSTSTRAFNVAARVPNTGGALKANSFARGELLLEQNVPTPVIPLEAVVSFAGVMKVYVISNSVALSREVSVGRIKDGRMEILAGLRQGEEVAVTGTTKLFDKAKVRIQVPEPETASR